MHDCLYVLVCNLWFAVLQCSDLNIKEFRGLFKNWMSWRQMTGDRWKALIDIINPAKTSQIGYWLLNEDDRDHRYLLSELIVAISNSCGTSDKRKPAFSVGQRVMHQTSGLGTIVVIDINNLRDRPYEVSFDTGETHQYTETSMMHKFTLELTKDDVECPPSASLPLARGLKRPVHVQVGGRAESAPVVDDTIELACSPSNIKAQGEPLTGVSTEQRPSGEKADECAQLRRQLSELQEQLHTAFSANQALEEQLKSSTQRIQMQGKTEIGACPFGEAKVGSADAGRTDAAECAFESTEAPQVSMHTCM